MDTFTQEQLDQAIADAKTEWTQQELNPVITERDDLLQYKPKDLTDEEKALQTKQQELFDKEVNLTLKEKGLEQFESVIKVADSDELEEVVKSLSQIVNDIKVSTGYVPEDRKKDNEYDKFAKEGNVSGMIGTKLANLFK